MSPIQDHPLRYAVTNELHARPFPAITVPCRAVHLAIKEPRDAASRDRELDRAHLVALLDRHGAGHPRAGATHLSAELGRHLLTWESHTEFVTYSAYEPGLSARAFDPAEAEIFPEDWVNAAPGRRLTSILLHIDHIPEDPETLMGPLSDWFVPESLACSSVLDGAAVVASDFRIDENGHMRFAVFVRRDIGPRRIGRIVQRLCEIETYKAMSMLGLARARELSARLNTLDPMLSDLVSGLSEGGRPAEEMLHELLSTSAELESLAARFAFRQGATAAYHAIVSERVAALRETRFQGRQTIGEFMVRRYEPSMRTVSSTQARLDTMLMRAERAGELLRTRVDVERSAQNQKLLESMDRRADLQLRLQHTVEGLSVVAISYYALNLATYAAYPLIEHLGISKGVTSAVLTPVVILLVWFGLARIKRRLH